MENTRLAMTPRRIDSLTGWAEEDIQVALEKFHLTREDFITQITALNERAAQAAERREVRRAETQTPVESEGIEQFEGKIAKLAAKYHLTPETTTADLKAMYEQMQGYLDYKLCLKLVMEKYERQREVSKVLRKYSRFKLDEKTADEIVTISREDARCVNCKGLEGISYKYCPKIGNTARRSYIRIVDGKVQIERNVLCEYEVQRRNAKRFGKANIPAIYANLSFTDYEGSAGNTAAVRWAKYVIENPEVSLFIYGKPGRGKTFLASIIAQELMKRGKSVVFVDVPALLERIKRTFDGKPDETLDEIMEQLTKVDMLVLDDMGAENPTEWAIERLFLIINSRYNAQKPIIATSNFDINNLARRFALKSGQLVVGEKLISRLAQMCKMTEITGVDYRVIRRNKNENYA